MSSVADTLIILLLYITNNGEPYFISRKNTVQHSSVLFCHLFMRNLLTAIFLLCHSFSFGQEYEKLSFSIQLQPELTYHKNNYAYRWRETYTKVTSNVGVEATVQYYVTNHLFAEAGLGYISRKLKSTVFLNQHVLPPPRQSWTEELVNTKSVSFRTIQLPVNFGYNIISKEKMSVSLNAGITANFLLNTFYEVNGFKQYEGTYKKNYWQGYSFNLGVGSDYKIYKKLKATGRISYAVVNTMKDDDYLFSQDDYAIPLPHNFLRLSVGFRMGI